MTFPNFQGSIDLATMNVTDQVTGLVYTWNDWNAYKQNAILQAHTENMRSRDMSSDLVNSPGIKTWFKDDLFEIYPETYRDPPSTPPKNYP